MKLLKHLPIIALVATTFFFSAASLHAQAPATTPAASADAAAKPTHKTLWIQIKEGGWVMFPIAALSILTLYFIGDGVMRTTIKRTAPPEQEEAIKDLFRHGDYIGAYNFCRDNPSPLTNVLRVGIGLLGDGKQVTEDGIAGELAKENSKMLTYISYLSVIGVCAPMVGLLGTVTGMMGAFATLATAGIGDPSALSGKIGEVLTATASGLFIAIPAFGAFYYLRARSSNVIHHIQDITNSLYRKMPYESLAGVHIGDDELLRQHAKLGRLRHATQVGS